MSMIRDVRLGWLALALLVSMFTMQAQASSKVQGLPNLSTEYSRLGLHDFVLGPVCLSLPSAPLEIDCNPAFLAQSEKKQFRLNLVTNDHIGTVNTYREKLASKDAMAIVDSVLNESDATVARASLSFWYQRGTWALGVAPFRGGFASAWRNQAYPEVSADLYKDLEVFSKWGFTTDDVHLTWGVQLRYLDRQSFRQKFDLLDAIADPSILKVEDRQVLFFEPGLNYVFDTSWSSSIAATITQLPVIQGGSRTEFKPVVDIGFTTSPPFWGQRLRTSTHFTGAPELPDALSRFKWGAVFEIRPELALSAILGKNEIGFGVNGHIDSVVLGAGWRSEDLAPDPWRKTRVSTLLVELGLVF